MEKNGENKIKKDKKQNSNAMEYHNDNSIKASDIISNDDRVNGKNITSTPYDDVFRTMLNDCSRFILPLLNEVFGENYDGTETIVFANDYHFQNKQDGAEDKIITDASFKVIKGDTEKKYHFECQSTIDNSMVLRFFEYDSQIALDDATIEKIVGDDGGKKSDGVLTVTFPHSAVLYLRSNKNTGDVMTIRFVTPGGEVKYDIPIIKMQTYTLEDIWEKEIYLLIPFYIFTHEANFPKYNEDEKLLQGLVDEFKEICVKMEELTHQGKMTELENRIIVELSKKVVDNIARKYERIRKGVEGIMGGKVIETEAKKMYNRGISEGILLGEENGRSEGIIGAIGILKDLNMSESEIKKQIIKKFSLSEDAAAKYLKECSK
ncbi:hypothetical protein [Butyribacter intestini]|jgi:hypothetical protein|nr:hypothetical protein [Butyribacter intestini]